MTIKFWICSVTFIIQALLLCAQNGPREVLWTIAWSPDGKYIATGGNQGVLRIFHARSIELHKQYDVKDVIISRVKWHPSANKLAVITQSDSFKSKILDLEEDKWIEFPQLQNSFRGLDWNYNGELIAISELEEYVSIFDQSGQRISRFRADEKGVTGLDWHPTQNILTTVGSQVGIYRHSGDTIKTFQPRTKEAFLLCVEWHNSGDFFAIGDYGDLENDENKLVQFWNMEGTNLNELKGSPGEYRNIRWSPDGQQLATASDALRIWSKEGELLAESNSTEDYLWGIDWSPDGNMIITTNSSGIISLWNKHAEWIRNAAY